MSAAECRSNKFGEVKHSPSQVCSAERRLLSSHEQLHLHCLMEEQRHRVQCQALGRERELVVRAVEEE